MEEVQLRAEQDWTRDDMTPAHAALPADWTGAPHAGASVYPLSGKTLHNSVAKNQKQEIAK
jgi:hypothetical protein